MSVFRINLRQLFDNAFFISCHRTSIIVFMRVHDVIFSEVKKRHYCRSTRTNFVFLTE